ncbi:MAG: type II toxin-antitoxin system RelE/ParE family toxin [Nitrospirae bacterium]|nr:MAG: type II toxin-antitoxin system RelE/ParE family toxin [Nitrospirota bacterium]
MIQTFADKRTEELYVTGRSRRLPPEVVRRALRKLSQLDAAVALEDLRSPPSNRLHALRGDRKGQYSISINTQWRICFSFRDGDAFDVEVCDYHH